MKFFIKNIIDYPLCLLEHSEDSFCLKAIWASILMSSKNSSLRKNETAIAYFKKETLESQIEFQKIIDIIRNKNLEKDENLIMATIGRAMHNITYLDGALELNVENNNVTNQYKKLGINRIFTRKSEII